jgi:mono/diheme cytochrome c family protein
VRFLVTSLALVAAVVLAGAALAAGSPKAGKAVWNANGCGGCHTFKAAGSTGMIGPAITKARIAADAKKAKKTVPVFVRASIVTPNAFVAKGYKKGVMPSYTKLTKKQLDDLVAFVATG